MAYYEYLRARGAFLIFAAVVIGLGLFVYAIAAFHSNDINVGLSRHRNQAPPGLSIIFFTSFAAWGTAILATVISASLNRQRDHLPYTWTRPESRQGIAVRFVAVDVAFLLAAFVLIIAVELACYYALIGNRFPIIWTHALPALLRAFGFALLWYAIVQAATAWGTFRGGVVAGISWPVFIVLVGVEASGFPSPWREISRALNLFNPMAYLSGTHVDNRTGEVVLQSLLPFDATSRLILMYSIAAIALVIAVLTWRRMEV